MYLIVNVNGRCDGRFRGHCYYIYLHLNLFKNLFYPPSSDLIYSRQNARIIRRRRRTRTAIAPLEVCVASCPLSLCNTRLTRYFLLCICICVCMCAPPPLLHSLASAHTSVHLHSHHSRGAQDDESDVQPQQVHITCTMYLYYGISCTYRLNRDYFLYFYNFFILYYIIYVF